MADEDEKAARKARRELLEKIKSSSKLDKKSGNGKACMIMQIPVRFVDLIKEHQVRIQKESNSMLRLKPKPAQSGKKDKIMPVPDETYYTIESRVAEVMAAEKMILHLIKCELKGINPVASTKGTSQEDLRFVPLPGQYVLVGHTGTKSEPMVRAIQEKNAKKLERLKATKPTELVAEVQERYAKLDSFDTLRNVAHLGGQLVRHSYYIPSSYVSLVIGVNGHRVKAIQKRTSTTIRVYKRGEDSQLLTIQGNEPNVKDAETRISNFMDDQIDLDRMRLLIRKPSLLGEEDKVMTMTVPDNNYAKWDFDVGTFKATRQLTRLRGTQQMRVSYNIPSICVPLLIGTDGHRIKDFKHRTNTTKIDFTKVEPACSSRMHSISIQGTESNIKHAESIIFDFIEDKVRLDRLIPIPSGNSPDDEDEGSSCATV